MRPRLQTTAAASAWALAALLSGCAGVSPQVGIGVPVGPVSVGVGVGRGGVSAGVGTGVGPVGVGVGVNQRGQVTGSAGVGVSTPIGGGAQVGVGVGTSRVLHDPAAPAAVPAQETAPAPAAPGVQWRDSQGRVVPACRVQGGC